MESVNINGGWLTNAGQNKDFTLTGDERKKNIETCVKSGKLFNYYADMQKRKDEGILDKLEMFLKTDVGDFLKANAPLTGSGTPCAENCRDLDSLRIEAYCDGVNNEAID